MTKKDNLLVDFADDLVSVYLNFRKTINHLHDDIAFVIATFIPPLLFIAISPILRYEVNQRNNEEKYVLRSGSAVSRAAFATIRPDREYLQQEVRICKELCSPELYIMKSFLNRIK